MKHETDDLFKKIDNLRNLFSDISDYNENEQSDCESASESGDPESPPIKQRYKQAKGQHRLQTKKVGRVIYTSANR